MGRMVIAAVYRCAAVEKLPLPVCMSDTSEGQHLDSQSTSLALPTRPCKDYATHKLRCQTTRRYTGPTTFWLAESRPQPASLLVGGVSGVFEAEMAHAGWRVSWGGDGRGGARDGQARHRRGGAASLLATFLPLKGLWI